MADRGSSLWIGSLEPYMTEDFLMRAFELMGEKPESIKIMRNKQTGLAAGFGFVQFRDEKQAMESLHKLNGKIIPYSQPPCRFKLNHSTVTKAASSEHALWVGDLSPDVDDYGLYKCFASRYNSVTLAKIVRESNGESKGYAFVNFSNDADYKDALMNMSGHRGLGSNPLRVSHAIPRNYNAASGGGSSSSSASTSASTGTSATSAVQALSQLLDPSLWQYGWQGYGYQGGYYDPSAGYGTTGAEQWGAAPAAAAAVPPPVPPAPYPVPQVDESEFELVEHGNPVEVEKMNREFFERNQEFWEALEESRWAPFDPDQVVPLKEKQAESTTVAAAPAATTPAAAAAKVA